MMRFMLFAGDIELARAAEASGVDRIVVDLERRHKRVRQHGYHLECSGETVEDLRRMRRAVATEIVCRINPAHPGTPREVEAVLAAGADVIMLPMFRHADEVHVFLGAVGRRARTSLLFETREAIGLAPRLDPADFDEVYVGLNDLALACGVPFCYQLVSDGLVDRMRDVFEDKPFGFGGVTLADSGRPLPTRVIAAEQARLGCSHVILRRAFKRDVHDRDMGVEILRLRALYERCLGRPAQEIEADRQSFRNAVSDLVSPASMTSLR